MTRQDRNKQQGKHTGGNDLTIVDRTALVTPDPAAGC